MWLVPRYFWAFWMWVILSFLILKNYCLTSQSWNLSFLFFARSVQKGTQRSGMWLFRSLVLLAIGEQQERKVRQRQKPTLFPHQWKYDYLYKQNHVLVRTEVAASMRSEKVLGGHLRPLTDILLLGSWSFCVLCHCLLKYQYISEEINIRHHQLIS